MRYNAPCYITGRTVSGLVVTGAASIDKLCRELGVTAVESFYSGRLTKTALGRELSRIHIFTLRDGLDAQSAIYPLAGSPDVEYAELYIIPEFCYTPNDPRFGEQWFLTHIHADDCWNMVRGDTTNHVVIGIDDSGVYWDHPDLAANIWVNEAEDVNHNGILDSGDIDQIDADSNGYVDDVIGWDFGNNDNNPIEDIPWHGTIVAGCASEVTDNNVGGAGIGFSARLMCVKATNTQEMLVGAYQGLVYAANNGADIINCSWGSVTHSQIYQNLINALYADGIFIVASAGNGSGQDTTYPAGYEHVLAVTGTDQNDHLFPGFGFGDWVDVAAPGVGILSTWGHSDYTSEDGTSLASPIAAGLAALIKAWRPSYNPDQLDTLIKLSADSIGSENPTWPLAIRINAANWLNFVGIESDPLPEQFELNQNYPNPFNAQTTIRYSLPTQSMVSIDIFDILGRKIETLAEGIKLTGNHQAIWDASGQASGIYFYRIKAGDKVETSKMLLLK
jgi:hypothetical protein